MSTRVNVRGLAATVTLLSPGPIDLESIIISNSGGAAAWVQFFDVAAIGSVTLGTTPPDMTIEIGAGAQVIVSGLARDGMLFRNGIAVAATTLDGGSVGAAATVQVTLGVS